MREKLLIIGVLVLLATPAGAWLVRRNARLDLVFRPGEKERLVLFVDVHDVLDGPPVSTGPTNTRVVFLVRGMLRGTPDLTGRALDLGVGGFSWPRHLVPRAAGARALLVLPAPEGPVEAVLPAIREKYEPVASREALLHLLACDLLDEALNRCGDDRERARQLIVTAAPVLTAEEAAPLSALLSDPSPWLRRAALAACVRATKDPGAMKLAAEDMAAFLPKHSSRTFVTHPGGGECNAYILFFEHYLFLTARWRDEGDREAAAFLPLFRVAEQNTRHAPADHWSYGIWPLLCAGTRDDLDVLHGDYRARLDRPGDSGERQWLLLGMGRILGLDLPILKSGEFATREAGQYRQVRAALKREGLLD
jgi:hypothetical protein